MRRLVHTAAALALTATPVLGVLAAVHPDGAMADNGVINSNNAGVHGEDGGVIHSNDGGVISTDHVAPADNGVITGDEAIRPADNGVITSSS